MAEPTQIPIIDFSFINQSRDKVSKEIVDALESVGFLFLDNVGFDRKAIEQACKWFHSLPESNKFALATKSFNPKNKNIYRGYFPADATNSSFKEGFEVSEELSQEECVSIGFPLYEPNRWPSATEEETAWFKKTLCDHYKLMHNTGTEVCRLIARGLGANEDWFDHMFSPYPLSTLRLINYPIRPKPIPDCARDGDYILHCGSHTDTPFITLLATFDYPGLQIQDKNDLWVDVPVRSDSLVLNIGDVLSKVTGKRLRATRHRVVDMGSTRQSVPYFLEPRFDANINRTIVNTGATTEEEELGYGPFLIREMKAKGYVEYEDLLK
ncbi:uncharacterized protein LOC114519206 [Dendronephthya gigantea]|uniref:uncharacterized protein LOC114519206 n=1 Tax=Dendronephthya gigantea TaxID=151771 RepID=UPI00106D430C|nr:uncharacterized protein LOC114519206 [Dendronephthya gigantea]XP_028395095.1 uncharacterized protein LOC114519206 [Dendronephthya gigantea]